MANVSLAIPAGSKLTRAGLRCQIGAGQAESGAASSGTPSLDMRFLQHRLPAAELRDDRIGFLAIVGHSTVGDVVAVPTGSGVISVEVRKIDRGYTARQAIDQQPASALPLPART